MAFARPLVVSFILLWSLLGPSKASLGQTRPEGPGPFAEARRCEERGDLPKAERLYLEYLHSFPRSAQARANLGVVFAHEGKLDKAIAEYKQALLIDSSLAPVHMNLGIACFKLGRFADASKSS